MVNLNSNCRLFSDILIFKIQFKNENPLERISLSQIWWIHKRHKIYQRRAPQHALNDNASDKTIFFKKQTLLTKKSTQSDKSYLQHNSADSKAKRLRFLSNTASFFIVANYFTNAHYLWKNVQAVCRIFHLCSCSKVNILQKKKQPCNRFSSNFVYIMINNMLTLEW